MDARVIGSDLQPQPATIGAHPLLSWTVQKQDAKLLSYLEPDLVLSASGMPYQHPIFQKARAQKIPVQSELEFALQMIAAHWPQFPGLIAVTGTDGKSTTTHMLQEVLRPMIPVVACGNFGLPVAKVATFIFSRKEKIAKNSSEILPKILIVECSSFQLEWLEKMRPDVAVILNVAEDHLDRYRNMREYMQAKFRIFRNQGSKDFCIVGASVVKMAKKESLPMPMPISPEPSSLSSAKYPNVHIISPQTKSSAILFGGKRVFAEKAAEQRFHFPGAHNLQNLQFALQTAQAIFQRMEMPLSSANVEVVRNAVRTMKGLPHRLEFLGVAREANRVAFFNDSKATTIQATRAALQSFTGTPVHLLLGGIAKSGDFSELLTLSDICFYPYGDSAQEIAKRLGVQNIFRNLEDAFASCIKKALQNASKPGRHAEANQIVLLSPACASYDSYINYIERGNHFQKLAKAYCQ